MQVTIIPSDSVVVIDGLVFNDIDMTSVDSSVHAVQWYGDSGEIEFKDPTTKKMVENATIDNLDAFSNVIAQFQEKKVAYEANLAEELGIEQIHEV